MICYAAAHGAQLTVDFNDGMGALPMSDDRSAVKNAMAIVEDWTQRAGCSSSIVVLSAVKSDSFRHRLYPPYKANRKGEKPLSYAAVREALELEFETMTEPGLEADDLMGMAASADPNNYVIVSRDKDMKTIPATVFNPSHDDHPVRIKPNVADMMWMKQTMVGDSVDNYPGIPKVGEKIAQEILTKPHRLRRSTVKGGPKWVRGESCSVWQSMLDYAAKAGMDEQGLILMAQVSRILRHGDFNKETRTVRLWRPGGHMEMKLDAH